MIIHASLFSSTEFRQQCWARLPEFDGSGEYLNERLMVRLSLLIGAIKFGEWATFTAHMPEILAQMEDDEKLEAFGAKKTIAILLKLIGQWHAAGMPADYPPITALLQAVAAVGGKKEVPYLKSIWQMAQQPAPTTHHILQDLREKLTVKPEIDNQPFSGIKMAMLRERRHLAQNQVNLAWSASAQNRFENGQTQLRLAHMDVLKDFLLSGWVDLINTNYNFHVNLFAHYREKITQEYYSGTLTGETAQALVDQYYQDSTDLAEPVRQVQTLELMQYAYTGIDDPMPDDIRAAVRRALKQMPGWNGDYISLFSDGAMWLPAAESYKMWRSVYGLTRDERIHVSNPTAADLSVALSIAREHDVKLAQAMLDDMPSVRKRSGAAWLNMWSINLFLAAKVCAWTINAPKPEEVRNYLDQMKLVGYGHEAEAARGYLAELGMQV
jgi:molybdopterin converting factor small subunit